MKSHYLCPVCQSPMMVHEGSQGLHCANKHHLDKHALGYWVFSQAKKPHIDSRQLMRAKHFLLASGIFHPLIEAINEQLAQVLASASGDICHLDFDCGEGYYLRALKPALEHDARICHQTGIAEAENALFTAAKAEPGACYIQSQLKQLPFCDEHFDIITLIDKPLKGKELLRVLKRGGYLLQVSPGPRHLWQLKELIYKNLTEKGAEPVLAKGLQRVSGQRIQFRLSLSGEQALTLLEMTPYVWRANEKIKRQIVSQSFPDLEVDLYLSLAVKQAE